MKNVTTKNKSQKHINENKNENNDTNNKRLMRPFSASNIRSFNSNISQNNQNKNLIEGHKINVINKNEIDLDLLFEKQLQKLREINKECDISEKKEENKQSFINNINNVNNYNQNDNNNMNKSKTPFLRPSSHSSKHIKSLPRISSPKYHKNLFQQKLEYTNNYFSPKKSFHKNFGKIPKYLQEMKIKNQIVEDIQRKKKEEEKYPKGTKLLSEEERLFTLQKLKVSKKELENLIEKLPISLNTLSSRNKQQIYYKKLDEIEQAITTFSKNQVFIKIDS